ncbi:MAG: rod shape-determining protein MreC [Candidatus Nealsonbacteria bacterium CG23_combo_of_CG06-09_8_20_14_all_36_12]|uniref:Cell shape-determining protein MreC n=2 Tax=Candidatus Nealsoniibacteriota TaxID=1817911 RepID=A0A2H0TLM6_9BACT|nr:MAG: rod shape-determining protein MreC [Candidatus Nealsonbacteria bacterium CG23_combo_of_CG06-09_8_20_14_all_36_12]PIR73058.1 MAG: rod shape-determining protein MreC [Candidatus Nealsonbacteria bacterium CG10_big_fil_rev_8_21_14_0_10_36_23]
MAKFSQTKNKILIVLIIILIISILSFFQKEVKNFFYLISSPIQKTFWQTGQKVSDFFEFWVKLKSLEEKNKELEGKNLQLLSEMAQLKELKKENEILRKALELELQKEFKLEIAEVISRDPSQDFILIGKGTKDGIEKDMAVITQEKALCGKVSEVYENFSRVMLISSNLSSFDAKILTPKLTEGYTLGSDIDIYGIVKGKGGLNLDLTLVPKEKEIKEGNLVATTSLGGIFPKGLLVGEIKQVKKSDIEPFNSASLKPLFNLQDLKVVFLITNF